MRSYPRLEVNLKKIRENIQQLKLRGNACNIQIAGVVKGVWSDREITRVYEEEQLAHIASSRIEQLKQLKEVGIKTRLMMIRTPMLSEAAEVIRYADISLQSEMAVIKALAQEAHTQGKMHDVMLMCDIGDLREGFFAAEELIEAALFIEREAVNLNLAGIGANLGCYGALEPTPEKLAELVEAAERVEEAIGRQVKYISGGATSSVPRVLEGTMPARINHLRLGEILLVGKDQQRLRGYEMPFLHDDAITLKAEIIEVKEKPSYPRGEFILDSFGNRPVFADKGIMKRAILAIGQADYGALLYGSTHAIIPKDEKIEILSASSDHTLLDVTNASCDYKVGDILEFDLWYSAMMHLFGKQMPIIYLSE